MTSPVTITSRVLPSGRIAGAATQRRSPSGPPATIASPARQLPHLRRAERERRAAVDRLARRVDDPQARPGERRSPRRGEPGRRLSACRRSSASAAPTSADASTPTASRPSTSSTTAAATPPTIVIRARNVRRPPTSAASRRITEPSRAGVVSGDKGYSTVSAHGVPTR